MLQISDIADRAKTALTELEHLNLGKSKEHLQAVIEALNHPGLKYIALNNGHYDDALARHDAKILKRE